jgi:hypothetical protein
MYPWVGSCDTPGCWYSIAGRTPDEVEAKLVHEVHKNSMKGKTVIRKSQYEKIWDELDETTSRILGGEQNPSEKAYAQGLAFALAAFAYVGLDTPQLIAREAKERWKMRTGEIPFRPTQGYVFNVENANFSPDAYLAQNGTDEDRARLARARQEAAAARAAAEAATPAKSRGKAKKEFNPQQQQGIKMARTAGMSDADLAKMYGCTEADIKAVV